MEGYHDGAKSLVMRRKGHRIYLMALLALDWKIFSAKSPSQGNALIGASEETHTRTTENQEQKNQINKSYFGNYNEKIGC